METFLQEKPLSITGALQKGDPDLDKDKLHLHPYARALTEFIQECPTPMTVGIMGDWGTGKTSLLNMMRGNEEDRSSGLLMSSRCLIVNFETWSYAQFNDRKSLPTACLFALTEKLNTALIREKKVDQEETKKRFTTGINRLKNVISKVEINAPGIKIPIGQALENNPEAAPDDLSQQMIQFRRDFEALVELWTNSDETKTNRNRVVICVDDLDRVEPVVALEMLEAIKNFLDVEGCVFVLAVDFEVIQSGMKKKFGSDVQISSGKSFFDKIIQLPFNMPKTSYNLKNYLKELVIETKLPRADKMRGDYLSEITAVSVGTNPRSIKRVMNYARLINLIREKNASKEKTFSIKDSEILYAFICMQIAWPELFAHFLSEPGTEMIHNLENWEYLQSTPQLKPLFARVPDEEKLMNDISAFFDTLFFNLDSDGDGQISEEEFKPILTVLEMAQFTSVDSKPRPRDQFITRVRENSKGNQDIDNFLDNCFLMSKLYLNTQITYRPSGTRYVTLVYKRKQLGTLVSLKKNPFVIRLNSNPETLRSKVLEITQEWSTESLKNVIRDVSSSESTLTGFGDSIIDIQSLSQSAESIRFLNIIIDSTKVLLDQN